MEEVFRNGRAQTGRWSDIVGLREFRQTALYHDYFRHTETRHQMVSVLRVTPQALIGLTFNRDRRDFRPEEVAALDLFVGHVAPWMRAVIGRSEVEAALALRELAMQSTATMIVDEAGAVLLTTERARQLMRDYFPPMALDSLPLEMRVWLARDPATRGTLTRERAGDRLLCDCGSATAWAGVPAGAWAGERGEPARVCCVRFTEVRAADEVLALQKLGLTSREAEVLRWMREGKRNCEIAIILGISERTADKHRENLFAKLGVETRSAAIATAWETLRAEG